MPVSAKRKKPEAVVWCDRGWQPVDFGFCPSEEAWTRQMKRMGCAGQPYPPSAGCCTAFTKDGRTIVIVTLNPDLTKGRTRTEIAGLLCHEGVHVWQEVRRAMGEKDPSIEFEAYSVQAIFQDLYQAWLDTAAPPSLLARGARRIKT